MSSKRVLCSICDDIKKNFETIEFNTNDFYNLHGCVYLDGDIDQGLNEKLKKNVSKFYDSFYTHSTLKKGMFKTLLKDVNKEEMKQLSINMHPKTLQRYQTSLDSNFCQTNIGPKTFKKVRLSDIKVKIYISFLDKTYRIVLVSKL
jgi:uncharacterized CHY-type Zn-finger protein